MQPTKKLNEGGLLPLIGILDSNTHIQKLNLASAAMKDEKFRSAGNGNSNARVLNLILKKNSALKEIDLSDNGLDDDGISEICDALKSNTALTSLNLSRNNFSSIGAEHLRDALTENKTIQKLDLSRNALGYHSINYLQCACLPKGIKMDVMGNFVFEEVTSILFSLHILFFYLISRLLLSVCVLQVLNSVSHGVGFILSIVGAILLLSETTVQNGSSTDYHFWACFLFSFSLMFLFLASTLYHSFFMLPHGKSQINAS